MHLKASENTPLDVENPEGVIDFVNFGSTAGTRLWSRASGSLPAHATQRRAGSQPNGESRVTEILRTPNRILSSLRVLCVASRDMHPRADWRH
jgi:hypothetical protein